MKKIKRTLLLWAMIALGITSTVAQNADCEPCQPGIIQTKIIGLCNYQWTGTYNAWDVIDGCVPKPYSINEPYIFVIIKYRTVVCNGQLREFIEDAVFVNNESYFNNVFVPYGNPNANPPCPPTIISNQNPSCNYTPTNPQNIKQAIADAIAIHVGSSNTSSYLLKDVVVKGSCYSLVKVEWPAGSFVDMPGGDGQPSKRINIGGSDSYVKVPCSDACCILKMKRIEVVDGNGFTTYKWTNIGVQQPDNEICESMPIPDFNSYNPKPKASILDPVTGAVIDIEPTFVSQEPCEPLCPTLVQSNGFNKTTFTTDLIEAKEEQIALTASPIPAKNVVTFSSSVEIKAIKVFDNAGRRVYEDAKLVDNRLDISGWNNAQYYIQVILESDEVKTLKILKN